MILFILLFILLVILGIRFVSNGMEKKFSEGRNRHDTTSRTFFSSGRRLPPPTNDPGLDNIRIGHNMSTHLFLWQHFFWNHPK